MVELKICNTEPLAQIVERADLKGLPPSEYPFRFWSVVPASKGQACYAPESTHNSYGHIPAAGPATTEAYLIEPRQAEACKNSIANG